MRRLSLLGSSLALLAISQLAQADVLSIATPSYDTPNSTAGVLRPTQGMEMTAVEQQFGAPADKRAPVGEPPITRWSYPDFDVFFEHQKVIHSVVKRQN